MEGNKIRLPDLIFIGLISIVVTLFISKYHTNSRFDRIEQELEYLKSDHDTIKCDLDTVKWNIDTLMMDSDTLIHDVKDLKKGQKFIYDEVKKNSSSNFFDLFKW